MSWKLIRLVYRAESPVSIGFHKLGFIQRTRYYIPGRTMWGAITAAVTRHEMSKHGGAKSDDYKIFGTELLNKTIYAGYFYAALDPTQPFLPCYTDDGLCYGLNGRAGRLSEAEFEQQFIGSMTQTAIAPHSLGTEDGSIHETEYILNHPRSTSDGALTATHFVGHLYVSSSAVIGLEGIGKLTVGWDSGDLAIGSAIERLVVGGEMKYGAGRLRLIDCNKTTGLDQENNDLFGAQWFLDCESPEVIIKSGGFFSAHVATTRLKEGVRGDIEPLVGREWTSDDPGSGGPGRHHSIARICWTPGSAVVLGNPALRLKLGAYGIWE